LKCRFFEVLGAVWDRQPGLLKQYDSMFMRNKDQFNEKECVEAIRRGDESAFKKLFLMYYDPLCNFGWRFTRSKAVSEDLVQDVFVDLWNLRKSLDPKRSVSVYLYQAVKNKAIDYLDHQKVVRKYQLKVDHSDRNIVHIRRPVQEELEFIRAARKAIDELPFRAQQVYTLHREDGLTYQEIAEVMDISIKTVESQMSRALEILRTCLSKYLPLQVTEETWAKIYSIRSGTEK
jgi:RNA polymerase sigma-70 factor, ECF subfamily